MMILLVDDDASLRTLMQAILTVPGHRILTAADGLEALEAARGHQGCVDLLITDYEMPGMDGLELAAQLVAERPIMNVLVISGKVCPVPERETAAWAFLEKPFTPQELLKRVHDILAEKNVDRAAQVERPSQAS